MKQWHDYDFSLNAPVDIKCLHIQKCIQHQCIIDMHISNHVVNHLHRKCKKILPEEKFLLNHHKMLKNLNSEVSKQTLLMSNFASWSFGTFWKGIFPIFIHLSTNKIKAGFLSFILTLYFANLVFHWCSLNEWTHE